MVLCSRRSVQFGTRIARKGWGRATGSTTHGFARQSVPCKWPFVAALGLISEAAKSEPTSVGGLASRQQILTTGCLYIMDSLAGGRFTVHAAASVLQLRSRQWRLCRLGASFVAIQSSVLLASRVNALLPTLFVNRAVVYTLHPTPSIVIEISGAHAYADMGSRQRLLSSWLFAI
ncbi:hypothetical protein Efla_007564 [Eimeria flavescens]